MKYNQAEPASVYSHKSMIIEKGDGGHVRAISRRGMGDCPEYAALSTHTVGMRCRLCRDILAACAPLKPPCLPVPCPMLSQP